MLYRPHPTVFAWGGHCDWNTNASSRYVGFRFHYPNLWWGRMPLMDDNAVYRPLSERIAVRLGDAVCNKIQRGCLGVARNLNVTWADSTPMAFA